MAIAKGLDIDFVVSEVSKYFDIKPEFIKGAGKHRKVSSARSIVCYLAVEKLSIGGREVARGLGISPSAVSKAVIRGHSDNHSELIWKEILKIIS